LSEAACSLANRLNLFTFLLQLSSLRLTAKTPYLMVI